jgi:type I restriction enzyme S subunit
MKFKTNNPEYVPITELLSKIVDNRGRTCPTSDSGIPLIATNCIRNEDLYPVPTNIRHVSQETYDSWFRGHPEPGDVIFVNKGTPGRVCLVPNPISFCIAQDMVALRTNKRIDSLYLLAAIRSPQVQNQILQMQVGTMIPHFKKGDFEKLLIPLFEMSSQRVIGKIYYELSQKIVTNQYISKTLEEIAQTIFKSWFVDFDPVKAKMAGEKPVGMDDATAALFPDSMEDSELGLIPTGWKVATVGEVLVKQKPGKLYDQKTSMQEGLIPVLDQGRSGVVGYHNDAPGYVATPDSPVVVFANHTCSLRFIAYPFSVIQNVFPILGNDLSVYWLFFALQGKQKFDSYKGHWPDLVIKPVVRPSSILTNAFEKLSSPLMRLVWNIEKENQSLVQVRDSLLPRLISGELQIPEEMLGA